MSSSSSSRSLSSPWPEDAPSRGDTASSVSDISTSTSDKRPPSPRKRPATSCSGISKPFRSPLKRQHTQSSMSSNAPSSSSTQHSPERSEVDPTSTSSTTIRKQRQALEARLLLLQQANKCLRENALTTLPQDIARWREAGQLAAQDLWKMTGADGGDWSGLSGRSRGDYGLESPSSSLQKRKAGSCSPPLLARRSRNISPGAEEEAAALRSIEDLQREAKGEDSQGGLSETSLPEVSELLRRSQSVVGSASTPRQRESALGTQEASSTAGERGMERKWNIGSMLDMLGADKSMLDWDGEEEDFRDASTI